MAFCFIMGTHEFSSPLKGYEGTTVQCQNCGNFSAHPIKRWPWFTFCFIPVIPLATHAYSELSCQICHFLQDMKNRPDVRPGQSQGAGAPMGGHGGQGGPPGGMQYGSGGGGGYGPGQGPPAQYR